MRNPTNNTNQPNTTGQIDHYEIKLKFNEKYQNFTFYNDSPVTIVPNNPTLYEQKDNRPLKERYQDVNKNEIKNGKDLGKHQIQR